MKRLHAAIRRMPSIAWAYLREVSGDDAYERYVAHHTVHHAGEAVMTRKDYFDARQRQKWSGISRCC
jgi:uncharacterized short protein YbdD (DUF466 family)